MIAYMKSLLLLLLAGLMMGGCKQPNFIVQVDGKTYVTDSMFYSSAGICWTDKDGKQHVSSNATWEEVKIRSKP